MDVAAGPDQYAAKPCAGADWLQPWTTPNAASNAFWTDAGLDMPQAAHMLPMQSMIMPLTPTNIANSGSPTDGFGLMTIAMPQCCDMNGEQIAAELRAAAPVCYED
jgi:hypothetical protein